MPDICFKLNFIMIYIIHILILCVNIPEPCQTILYHKELQRGNSKKPWPNERHRVLICIPTHSPNHRMTDEGITLLSVVGHGDI